MALSDWLPIVFLAPCAPNLTASSSIAPSAPEDRIFPPDFAYSALLASMLLFIPFRISAFFASSPNSREYMVEEIFPIALAIGFPMMLSKLIGTTLPCFASCSTSVSKASVMGIIGVCAIPLKFLFLLASFRASLFWEFPSINPPSLRKAAFIASESAPKPNLSPLPPTFPLLVLVPAEAITPNA